MSTQTSRRSGGRTARRSARSAPLPDHLKPVRAGMKGGTFSPLSKSGMDRIHQAALDALETIGLSQAPQTGVEYLTAAGAKLGDDGRIRFPRALVEDTIARANRSATLLGPRPTSQYGAFRHPCALRHGRCRRASGRGKGQAVSRQHSARRS